MVFFVKDAWVWLEHSQEAWLPVQLMEQQGDNIVCKSQLGEIFTVPANTEMPHVHPSSLVPVENMVKLEELSEGAILHNLKMRYNNDDIYTYISSILISVNPFKMLGIYSPATMDDYRVKMAKRQNVAPHVYALADETFSNLTRTRAPQSIIVSGESGAGKTEATKLVLQYLAEMSGQGSAVEQQLLQANPIIEAFGNAKTVRNNNSSRFGKWIEVIFDTQYHIRGARIYNYLLEKSRIVHQGPNERNYHAFYQICAGASPEMKAKLKLETADKYRYASGGQCFVVDGVSDVEAWQEVQSALTIMNFTAEEVDFLFSVLAGVMHLGNVSFKDQGSKSVVTTQEDLANCCLCLSSEVATLEKALTTRNIKAAHETIVSPLSADKAAIGRDALAKALYGNLFDWLIQRVNVTLESNLANFYTVGVLDIFGFEIFETNRFEQFCINYANEKLQQHFNHEIFTIEQQEYKEENIDVAHVDFIDNQPCLDLIESKKGGILAMTDEELRIPKGSDLTLLDRMDQKLVSNKYYTKRKMGNPVFTIQHYAGPVTYSIQGFLEKNKDALEDALKLAIKSSGNQRIVALMEQSEAKEESPRKGSRRVGGKKQIQTLGSKFKSQLVSLMDILHSTTPQFIRCIKPNSQKVPDYFDSQMVARQLRYLGIQEVVKIRQLGYPVRSTHKNFFFRYKVLANVAATGDDAGDCTTLMNALADVDAKDWRVGKTKVFVRQGLHSRLESERESRIEALLIKVQALVRMRIWRTRYKKVKAVKAALVSALETAEDHTVLEKAIDDYESLGFATDDALIRKSKERAKVLYEHAQARRALTTALESRREDLLRAAIESARAAKLDSNTKEFAEAESFLAKLVAYQQALATATKDRNRGLLQQALATSQELGLPQDSSAIADAKQLVDRLLSEEKASAELVAAATSRDLARLQAAIRVAKELRLPQQQLAPAQQLVAQLLKERAALKDLQGAVEAKRADRQELENALAAAAEANIPTDNNLVAQAKQLVAKLQQEEAKRQQKEQQIASAKESLEGALQRNDRRRLEAAVQRAESIKGQHGQEAAAVVDPLIGKAKEAIVKLQQQEAAMDTLRKAIDAPTISSLSAALDALGAAGVADNDEAKEARRLRDSIAGALEELKSAYEAKDVDLLSRAIAAAEGLVTDNSNEWKEVQTYIKHKQELVAEREARTALEFAMKSKNDNMLNAALTTAKKQGVDANDELVKEATSQKENIEQENIVREQELVVAQRRATVAQAARVRRQTKSRRVSVLDAVPESETKVFVPYVEELKKGTMYHTKNEYELHRFGGLRAPAEYAKGKLFGKGALKAGMLYWTGDVIPTSLTKLIQEVVTQKERAYEKELVHQSVQMFKSITGFMGDRHYSFPDTLAAQILAQCLQNYLLRDELFVQVLKQLRRNKKKESLLRGYQLLALAVETFPPSDEFIPFLLYFLQLHSLPGERNDDARNYSKYCLTALCDTMTNPPKTTPPTIEYISAFRDRVMTAGNIMVYFLDNTSVQVDIEPTTLVADVIEKVRTKIGLKAREHGFALYELVNGNRNYLEPTTHVTEYESARWDAAAAIHKAKTDEKTGAKLLEVPATKFLFAKRMYMGGNMARSLANDPIGISLMYHQAVDEVSRGNYFVPMEQAAQLAAIHEYVTKENPPPPLSAEFRDKNYAVYTAMSLRPPGVLFTSGKITKKKFEAMVTNAKQKLPEKCRATDYLRVVSRYPLYGAQFFTVQQADQKNEHSRLPQTMILGVNMGGAYLMDWNTRDLICFFPIQSIAGWKGTAAMFIIRPQMDLANWFNKELGAGAPKKGLHTFYLKTEQGKHIATLVRAYVDALIALVKAKKAAKKK